MGSPDQFQRAAAGQGALTDSTLERYACVNPHVISKQRYMCPINSSRDKAPALFAGGLFEHTTLGPVCNR